MKTLRNILTAFIAAGAPGVALLALTNRVPTETAFAVLTVGALVAFAAFDYSRRTARLQTRATILRPTLPARSLAQTVSFRRAA